MNIHDYFGPILETTFIEEWFADCEHIGHAVNAIVEAYPLPEGITKEDVEYYIQEEWDAEEADYR